MNPAPTTTTVTTTARSRRVLTRWLRRAAPCNSTGRHPTIPWLLVVRGLLVVLVGVHFAAAQIWGAEPAPPSGSPAAEAPSRTEASATADEKDSSSDESSAYRTESLRGRIVWMSEALQRRFGIKTVPEAAENLLALETREGQLHPLVEDLRGRAFRRDERLRELADCELLVRRYEGSPMVQVIRLFAHEDGHTYELDYWCEICAITMFELKPCDCCQGEIELRRRRVELPANR